MANLATVVASRKLGLVFVTSMLCLQLCNSLQNGTSVYTVQVYRRISLDIYILSSDLNSENCDPTLTYLVNERKCVSDQELYSGCSLGIIPTIMQSIIPIADVSFQDSTITNIQSHSDSSVIISTFVFNKTKQLVNSSFCNISTLEVYRGREQAIKIDYEGFYLSDNGTIEIHKDQIIAYAVKDFEGELYRMNLTCFGEGLPESGCLFFKITGRTNTTNAKFNNTVPGTLIDNDGSNLTTEISDLNTFSKNIKFNVTTTAAVTVPITEDLATETFKVGSVLFYVVVGVTGGIIVITFGFIIACVLIGFSVRRKRKSHTLTTASTLQPHNVIQTQGTTEPSPYENPQQNSSNLTSNNYPHTGDTNSDNNYRVGHDRYQVQHFSPTVIEHPNVLPQKELRTENNALETWCNDENKQLGLCASVQNLDSKIEDSKEDLELSQVYDTVSSKPSEEGVAEGLVYSQLSRPARHGKQSLPAYLGAPEYSALNVSKASPHTKIGDSMPVYEAPDVTTKVQRNEAMILSSHKVSSWSCPPLPLFITETKSRNMDHERAYAILEQDQLQLSTCAQAKITESEHTYSILEQDQVERLSPNESTTKEADIEHAYAILEQDQLLSHSNQIEPKHQILEEEKEPKSWMFDSHQSLKSDRERKHSASRDVHFELVQIYNTVSPKPPETRAIGKQLSHQACSKKQSLPSYLGALPTDYSALEVRSAPDVKKKKQKRKKKWSEDQSSGKPLMTAASHKISTTSCPPLSLFTESVDTHNPNTMNGQHSLGSASSRRRKQSVTEHTQHLASLMDNTFPYDEPTSLSLAPKEINSESKTIENEG